MITEILLYILSIVLGFIFGWIPDVTIASIPVIGESVANTLVLMVGYWNSAVVTLPYLGTIMTVFQYLIIFEISLLTLKFFLGHRAPISA